MLINLETALFSFFVCQHHVLQTNAIWQAGYYHQTTERMLLLLIFAICLHRILRRGKNANPIANCYYFDVGNITNDLEVHQEPLYPCHSFVAARPNYVL